MVLCIYQKNVVRNEVTCKNTVSVLTSLPIRSMLLSITPQGVMPTVFLFLRSWLPKDLTASPTYLDTPGGHANSSRMHSKYTIRTKALKSKGYFYNSTPYRNET